MMQTLPDSKKFTWQQALQTSDAEWMDWQILSAFNLNWILMAKIHCFCSVDGGMTGSRHYFGKVTDFF